MDTDSVTAPSQGSDDGNISFSPGKLAEFDRRVSGDAADSESAPEQEASSGEASLDQPEAESADPAPASQPAPKGAEKRISQLLSRAKAAEEQRIAAEHQNEQLKAALEIMREQLASKSSRLQEIDDISPERAELEQARLQLLVQAKEREMEAKYAERLQKAQFQAQVDQAATALVDQVEEALARFPAISKRDLALSLRDHSDMPPMALAEKINTERMKAYEPEILKRVKPAPQPTKPQSSSKSRDLSSKEAILADLRASLGNDWMQR